MKRLALLLLLFLLPLYVHPQQADRAPKLMVTPGRTHDFGNITHRDRPTHTFTLQNISLDTVRIAHVKSSCGCTVAALSDSLLVPAAKTAVDVKFYPPRGSEGIMHKTLMVYLFGENRSELTMRITATIVSDFSLSTKKLSIGTVPFRSKHSSYVEITNTSADVREIVDVQSALAVEARTSGSDFTHPIPIEGVRITPRKATLQPGGRVKILVEFEPHYRGRIMGSIVITAQDENLQVEYEGESS